MAKSLPEEVLLIDLEEVGLGKKVKREFLFHPSRKWRADFAFPESMLLIEVEGGTRKAGGGRHQRAEGFEGDCEKYNAAQLLGYKVLRFTTDMITRRKAVPVILEALGY